MYASIRMISFIFNFLAYNFRHISHNYEVRQEKCRIFNKNKRESHFVGGITINQFIRNMLVFLHTDDHNPKITKKNDSILDVAL